jgi:hypothetical protein
MPASWPESSLATIMTATLGPDDAHCTAWPPLLLPPLPLSSLSQRNLCVCFLNNKAQPPPPLPTGWGAVVIVQCPSGVGTLQNGYIQNVPLPRVVPRIQSASHMTSHGADPNTCYSHVPQVPTCSNLSRSLQGLGGRQLLPLFPYWLM